MHFNADVHRRLLDNNHTNNLAGHVVSLSAFCAPPCASHPTAHLELNIHAHWQLSSSCPDVSVIPGQLQSFVCIPVTQLLLVAYNLERLSITNLKQQTMQQYSTTESGLCLKLEQVALTTRDVSAGKRSDDDIWLCAPLTSHCASVWPAAVEAVENIYCTGTCTHMLHSIC